MLTIVTIVTVITKCHHTSAKWQMVGKQQGWGTDTEKDVGTHVNVIIAYAHNRS